MNYVLCAASYGGLFIALDIKNSGKEITVVTDSEGIKKYCVATNIKFIYYEPDSPVRLGIIPINLIRFKNGLDTVIRKINFGEEDSLYLLTQWFSYENFYLTKEVSKKGKGTVYFAGIGGVDSKIYKPKFKRVFFQMLFIKYLLRIFLGLDLVLYEHLNGRPYFGIDAKFFKQNKIKIIDIMHDRDPTEFLMDVVKKNQIIYHKKYDNLLIGSAPAITSMVKYDSIRNVYKYLSDLPLEFAFKKRPKSKEGKSQLEILGEELFADCEELLPAYVPAELLLNNIKGNVIAITSFPLVAASQMKHLKAISLLELVDWYNQSLKSETKKFLMKKSKNRIIFVKDLEELKQILTGSKVKT